jgi:putative ATP-binding cassette transporter
MYPLVIDASTYSSSNDVEQIDNYLLEILKEVKLDNLADRMCKGKPIKGLYKEKDWSKVLSLGEQQRLAFARVLYNKPKVVVVDEATSAMDVAAEEAMYKLLQSKGISYISVGHRPTLEKFHNRKLTITSPYADIAVAPLSTNA